MKRLLMLALAAMFSFGIASAGDDEEHDIEIAEYDEDGDGLLSRMEVASRDDISAQFEELDANGDGLLGEDELDEGPIDDFDEIGEDKVKESDNEEW